MTTLASRTFKNNARRYSQPFHIPALTLRLLLQKFRFLITNPGGNVIEWFWTNWLPIANHYFEFCSRMTVHISLDNPTQEHRLLLSTLSTHISKSKRTVIVTGAGISCNAGIPVPPLALFVQLTISGFSLTGWIIQPRQSKISQNDSQRERSFWHIPLFITNYHFYILHFYRIPSQLDSCCVEYNNS